MRNVFIWSALTLLLLLIPFSSAFAAGGAGHGGAITTVLFSLIVILIASKLGGDLAVRVGQPEVLGEIIIGVIVGNLTLIGINSFEFLKHDEAITVLSELGVILLLFEVGLETSVGEMMKVGVSSLLAAIIGVVFPFFLGWGVSAYFVPEAETLVHVFVGATLCATSVGITARVLKDIGKIQTPEAKIILGAAVIDDVLGLLVLGVVGGIISAANKGEELATGDILQILIYAVGFLIVAVLLGRWLMPKLFDAVRKLRSKGLLLSTSLLVCFGMSYLAAIVGLAPIVGAFTAGLILEDVHYNKLGAPGKFETVEELIAPIVALLVPIFFVVMGARVDLTVFADPTILLYALVLTVAAILGKQACGLGVVGIKADKVSVGFGMIPRGEVGLIFAGIGTTLILHGSPVVDGSTFGAVVIMVIVTTLVTPPLLSWRFDKLKSVSATVEGDKTKVQQPSL